MKLDTSIGYNFFSFFFSFHSEVVEHACSVTTLQMGETVSQITKDMDTYSYRVPLGVCAGITPYVETLLLSLLLLLMNSVYVAVYCDFFPSTTFRSFFLLIEINTLRPQPAWLQVITPFYVLFSVIYFMTRSPVFLPQLKPENRQQASGSVTAKIQFIFTFPSFCFKHYMMVNQRASQSLYSLSLFFFFFFFQV